MGPYLPNMYLSNFFLIYLLTSLCVRRAQSRVHPPHRPSPSQLLPPRMNESYQREALWFVFTRRLFVCKQKLKLIFNCIFSWFPFLRKGLIYCYVCMRCILERVVTINPRSDNCRYLPSISALWLKISVGIPQ